MRNQPSSLVFVDGWSNLPGPGLGDGTHSPFVLLEEEAHIVYKKRTFSPKNRKSRILKNFF